jgi:hypothetical protein
MEIVFLLHNFYIEKSMRSIIKSNIYIDTHSTELHDRPFSWLGTDNVIQYN